LSPLIFLELALPVGIFFGSLPLFVDFDSVALTLDDFDSVSFLFDDFLLASLVNFGLSTVYRVAFDSTVFVISSY